MELLRLVLLLTAHTELIAADTIRTDPATRTSAEPDCLTCRRQLRRLRRSGVEVLSDEREERACIPPMRKRRVLRRVKMPLAGVR